MATLTLALLSRFESSLGGQPLVKFRTSRVQALLAYLSTEFALGAQLPGAPPRRRSSPVKPASSSAERFESSLAVPDITNVETFLAGLRFEHRSRLADLPLDLVKGNLE